MKISDYAQKRYIILNKIVKYSKIKTKFKINYLRRDVNLVLIEEYKPEISALKQKLEEMRGSL